MELKVGKGLKAELDGDKLILSLDPESETETKFEDAEKLTLVGGPGITIKTNPGTDTLTIENSTANFTINTLVESGIDLEKSISNIAATIGSKTINKERVDSVIEKKNLGNLKTSDNHIECDHQIVLKGSKEKTRESYRPTESQLALINAQAGLELQTKDSGYLFEFVSSTTDVDYSYQHMDNKAITDMAKQTPGRPFFADHMWNTKSIIGRLIKGKNEGGKLIQWAYVPDTTKNKDVIEDLLNGNINRLSVGFSIDYEDLTCDSCSKSVFDYDCDHYPGHPDDKGNIVTATIKRVKTFYEVSAVGIPCNIQAGVRKGFELEADLLAKTLNSPIFEKGGLISDPENLTRDTIENDNTIQDSTPVELEDKELEAKEEVVEEAAPEAPGEAEAESTPEEVVEEKEAPVEPEVKTEVVEEKSAPVATSDEVLVKLLSVIETLNNKVESLEKKVDESTKAKESFHASLKSVDVEEVKEKAVDPSRALLNMFSLNFGLEDQE